MRTSEIEADNDCSFRFCRFFFYAIDGPITQFHVFEPKRSYEPRPYEEHAEEISEQAFAIVSLFSSRDKYLMDNHHFRSILLTLQDRLSDDDRRRLHFFLGDDVPRRISDDPSLSGTLSLLESLFDQDKISAENFSFLIEAFDEIRCLDAVKLLRGKHNDVLFLSPRPSRTQGPNAAGVEQSVDAQLSNDYASFDRSSSSRSGVR